MRRSISMLIVIIGLIVAKAAAAESWVVLGEREDGPGDRVRFEVGLTAGAFSRVVLEVSSGPLEVSDFAVQFINGGPGPQNWHPKTEAQLMAGQRGAEIDLPGNNRTLSWIEIKFKNPNPRRHAKFVVSGLRVGGAEVADPQFVPKATAPGTSPVAPGKQPTPPAQAMTTSTTPPWDSTGWVLLGEHELTSKGDRAQIASANSGSFTKLTIIGDGEFELSAIVVQFALTGPGLASWRSQVKHVFTPEQRMTTLNVPGSHRTIKSIQFRYRAVGTARSKITIWGK